MFYVRKKNQQGQQNFILHCIKDRVSEWQLLENIDNSLMECVMCNLVDGYQKLLLPPFSGYLTEDWTFCYQEFKGKVKHYTKCFLIIRQNFSILLTRQMYIGDGEEQEGNTDLLSSRVSPLLTWQITNNHNHIKRVILKMFLYLSFNRLLCLCPLIVARICTTLTAEKMTKTKNMNKIQYSAVESFIPRLL